MLSYQHIYHAGNLADLHKHGVLARLLGFMTQKARPLSLMETHGGRGLYDLSSPEAAKTGEAAEGIGATPSLPPELQAVLSSIQGKYGSGFYAGSPLIMHHFMRQGDRQVIMELHPTEHAALEKTMRGMSVQIHKRDGYEGILALSPPQPRRGLVLVDPSYEVKAEYGQVVKFTAKLLAKWPQAVVMIWYPLLEVGLHEEMKAGLVAIAPEIVFDEVHFKGSKMRMLGSGLALINKPYGFD
ncbi:MAG: 23S rRNA (adenine(2030)-N(6))-methyltransferase RlmJ [Pseudobdellovibrionaceae bacterium]